MQKIKLIAVLMAVTFATACYEALEPSMENVEVVLVAPVNNLVTTDSVHTFFWEEVERATEYELQIVSPRFDSIARFVMDTVVTKNQFTAELDKGVHEWRVRAMNNSTVSPFSAVRRLTIQ